MLTEEEFFLALAQLGNSYKGEPLKILKVLIGLHANRYGIDVDDDGPYDERDIIVVPLQRFLQAVVDKMDLVFLCALGCIAWKAYQDYQKAKSQRIQRDIRRERDWERHVLSVQ